MINLQAQRRGRLGGQAFADAAIDGLIDLADRCHVHSGTSQLRGMCRQSVGRSVGVLARDRESAQTGKQYAPSCRKNSQNDFWRSCGCLSFSISSNQGAPTKRRRPDWVQAVPDARRAPSPRFSLHQRAPTTSVLEGQRPPDAAK